MYRSYDKKSTFRSGRIHNKSTTTSVKTASNDQLHPFVKKRRFFWLCVMVLFIGWFMFQLVVQQLRIWDREEKLTMKQQELRVVQAEKKQLQIDVKKFQSPDYLLEMAHKLGYSKTNEQNYYITKE